ncbi:polysaccharide biosynthesis C-terminal domain-containing protein [Micromonospora tulbaghiae]|uniref:polysaccharide biosynthesis C-terminal domain-containing protein n=1 Tax=Micromonospora tulbaghiae TaxID=479978 RepID=UPI003427CA4D
MNLRTTEAGTTPRRWALTGAGGFLGWHVRVLALALGWPEPILVGRSELTDPETVASRIDGVDLLLHLAGVNLGEPGAVAAGNRDLARVVADGLGRCATPPGSVVFANSVLAGNGTPYGDSKARAEEILRAVRPDLVDVRLSNLYGEHGHPLRNGVTAIFCGLLAAGRQPTVHEDRELDLVHVTDAAARLLGAPQTGPWDAAMPSLRLGVRALAERLTRYATVEAGGDVPEPADRHAIRLFNTYRSHSFTRRSPGRLARPLRPARLASLTSEGAPGVRDRHVLGPGESWGDRFHLATVRRLVVTRGSAEIALRRVGHHEVVRLTVDGEPAAVLDIPTMWACRVTNRGSRQSPCVVWHNDVSDPVAPDAWHHLVELPDPVGSGNGGLAVLA